ncbi:hypothetical protein SAMN05660199_00165 [Klenkia soli]|uniref:Uncharacterized protein n=1 Tax=Klenkia soli TaxID=1052260 RepID=A0A1H0BZU2_9ACTN|nr:hypothetical protein [Klenkia soli]SDN51147.1 hypothetical protein SAMN05660199_00165 [Klenkia soli]
MTAHEGPAPQPTGTGPTENVAATKPLSLGQHGSREGVTRLPSERFHVQLRRARRRAAVAERAARHVDGTPVPCARSLRVEVGRHTAWLHGEDVRALLAVAQIDGKHKQYDGERECWMVPVDYADQVMTVAEWHQRRLVTQEAVDR